MLVRIAENINHRVVTKDKMWRLGSVEQKLELPWLHPKTWGGGSRLDPGGETT